MSVRRLLMLFALSISFGTTVGAAQTASRSSFVDSNALMKPLSDASSEPCDYDSCALTLQIHRFSWRIVRGKQETPVATIGFKAPDLASIVNGVPEAVAQAKVFERSFPIGGTVMVVGAAIALTSYQMVRFRNGSAFWATAGVVGAITTFYGARKYQLAIQSLNRSLRLYNESLQR